MNSSLKRLIKSISVAALLVGGTANITFAAATDKIVTVKDDIDTLKLAKEAYSARIMIQNIAKDYMYIGEDIATTDAQRDLKWAMGEFEKLQKNLNSSINNPKLKNLLIFINMNYDEMKELLKQKYNLDRAQELIDLAEAISEGEKKIMDTLRKKLKGNYPIFDDQRYNIIEVAKYYIAYTAGIKDANTVRRMKISVEELQKGIDEMKRYPGNTVEMNRAVAKIEKLWKVVYQFYLDIEDGGLPLIVYQTTEKLEDLISDYEEALMASLSKK